MLLNMKDLLAPADAHGFGIPAFNICTGTFLKTVIECCEELHAPVISEIHPSELAFQGKAVIAMCREMALESRVPICIHLDHGASIEEVMVAINAGFTSVMIDASQSPYEDNIRICREVVSLAHPLGISVEGELGTIGTTGNDAEGGTATIAYTDPKRAADFVQCTGIDTLAVAIGTAHGLYPEGFVPELRLELLKEIRAAVPVPLVLHGGSGNNDEEIAQSVQLGISKVNISSDIKDPFYQQLRLDLAADKFVREPFEVYKGSIEVLREVVKQKIRLLDCENKSQLYTY